MTIGGFLIENPVMRLPRLRLPLLFAFAAFAFLFAFVQFGIMTIAFERLGLSPHSAALLLFACLAGSGINLPLFSLRAIEPPSGWSLPDFAGVPYPPLGFRGRTVVAVNVGGCVIPVAFSVYLLNTVPIPPGQVAAATVLVAWVCYATSRPVPRLGVALPVFVAPVSAALAALLFGAETRAPLAYVCGTLGVLVGADLLRLGDIRKLGAPIASIGGAGTFDGIFITGIVAVLLA